MAYEVPALPYPYDALEPYIDEETMRLHHDKHHQSYADKASAALEGTDWIDRPVEDILPKIDRLPKDRRTAFRNNGGGYANHSLFWETMSPEGGDDPEGLIADAIEARFGSFKDFRQAFAKEATSLFGSGWTWLVWDGGHLELTTTPNQDSPLMAGHVPLLGLDVWEHAYYLSYRNRRPEYVEAWWNLVHWHEVGRRYEQLAGKGESVVSKARRAVAG